MKSLPRYVFLPVLVVLAFGGRARAQIDVQPITVALQGERNKSPERTISLSSAVAVKQLRCVLRELTAQRPDKSEAVLPSSAVTFTCPSSLAAGEPQNFPLVIKLAGVASGEYNGELLLLAADDKGVVSAPQRLAIKVRVRDGWPLPVALLVFSVLASVGLSIYRSTGKPRDEILVRLGPVRAAVQSDKELNRPYGRAFAELFARHIGDVEQALIAGQWNDAQLALLRAEAALGRWSRHRATWVELLRTLEEYRSAVTKAPRSYPDATERWLSQLAERAAQAESPVELRDTLAKFALHIPELVAFREQLAALAALAEQGEPELRTATLAKYHELEQQFLALAPDDVVATRALRVKVDAAIKEATARVHATMSRSLERGTGKESTPPMGSAAPEPRPEATRISDREVESATLRQRSYAWMGYLLTVSVLAAIGFQELYANNPLFGAKGLGDYLTVLLWGFGTEATRASVLGTASGWGLPGLSAKARE